MNTLQVIFINTRLNFGSMYNEIVCKLSKNTGPTVFSCARHIYERSTRDSNIKFSILYDTVPKDLRVCAGITVNTPGLCIILEHHVNPTYEEHGGSCYTKLEG